MKIRSVGAESFH